MQAVVWVRWEGNTPWQELSSRRDRVDGWSWYGCQALCVVKPQPKLAGGQRPLQSSHLPRQIKSQKLCFYQKIQSQEVRRPTRLDAKHKLYNCCPWLWGLHVGNRAKLSCPEAVQAAVLASSHPNKPSCLSQSTEVQLCPLSPWPPSSCHPFPPWLLHQLFAWPVCRAAQHQTTSHCWTSLTCPDLCW